MKHSISEISKLLAANAENVARFLLPQGKRNGQLWEAGGTNGHSGKSLKINLEGENAGKWRDWADTGHGDLIDLWADVKSITTPEAFKNAKEWLGIREIERDTRKWEKPRGGHPTLAQEGIGMTFLTQKRGLEPKIVNLYKVSGDKTRKAIAFPCYSPNGELLNHSYRGIEAGPDGKKQVWQDKGCAPSIFGWQSLTKEDWEKREILICEGQIDAMTWRQWGINAVSIPNGSGQTWIEHEWDNLEAFSTIYISFDTDGKSDENLKSVVNRLGKHRCKIVKIDCKDANDALLAGKTRDDAERWIKTADYAPIPHVCLPEKFADKVCDLFFNKNPNAQGFTLPVTTHKYADKSFRFREGELTMWTGTSGHGKSTLLNCSTLFLAIECKKPTFIISLETAPPEILRRQIVAGGGASSTDKEVRQTLKFLDEFLIFYDKIGHINKKDLFDVMSYVHARYGVANIVIDSMMRIDGLEEDYPAQTALVIELVTFARETGVHVHLVAHPRKSVGDDSPKGQDMSGSGNIRNNADNILVLWRNTEKERKAEDGEDVSGIPDAILTVEKDRIDGGFRRFLLKYDHSRYAYAQFEGEYHRDKTQPKKKPWKQ